MEKINKTVVGLLVLSLVFNFAILNQMGKIRSQLQEQRNIINNNAHQLSNLHSSIYGINGRINEIHKENKWVTDEQFTVNKENSTIEEILLNVQWAFSEVENGAKVFLLYSDSDSEDWTQIEADKISEGIYNASMKLSPQRNYKYKAVVQGNITRSSEAKNLPSQHYRPMPLMVGGTGTSSDGRNDLTSFSLEVYQHGPLLLDSFSPKRVQIKIYQDNKLEKVIDLEKVNESEEKRVWNLSNVEFEKSPTSIVLEVEYKDGRIDSGEVWPEDEYHRNVVPKI